MRQAVVLLSFLAAVLFLALAVFEVTLEDVPLVPAGLLCMAIGFAVERLPRAQIPTP